MSHCPSIINPFIHGPVARRERATKLRAMAEDLVAREWREILLRLANSNEMAEDTEDCAA
jgi:hypothetical protein